MSSESTEIPESFVDQIKDALENLYDFPVLQRHPLVTAIQAQGATISEPPAHRLRRELIEAIETLNPKQAVSVRSGAARIYNLLHLHYVGGMTLQETAFELGISPRQAYRDLRRGQENIAALFWYRYPHQSAPRQIAADPQPDELFSVQSEMERMEGSLVAIDLCQTMTFALKAVQKLADAHGVEIHSHIPQEPVMVTTNPAVAQQVLIHLLSQTIQQIEPHSLTIELENQPQAVIISLSTPPSSGDSHLEIDPVITQLISQIHWKVQQRADADGYHIQIRSATSGATLLIIDDNDGLVDLLLRYFTGYTYQVIAAYSGEEGLRKAEEFPPDAIIMDLMMPGMDGWELLQRLRTKSEMQHIPVIICSVINDPELAYSLGASHFIAKPFNKETLLAALQELL